MRPTKPGWYWARPIGATIPGWSVVYYFGPGSTYLGIAGSELALSEAEFHLWAGEIRVPD